MRKSTAWWIVGVVMLFVGCGAGLVNLKLPYSGGALLIAGALGYAAAMAALPLIVGAITRFRYPWPVLGVFVVVVGLASLGARDSSHQATYATIAPPGSSNSKTSTEQALPPQALHSTEQAAPVIDPSTVRWDDEAAVASRNSKTLLITRIDSAIEHCVQEGSSKIDCFMHESPQRCRGQVFGLFVGANSTNLDQRVQAWGECVETCEGSNAADCAPANF